MKALQMTRFGVPQDVVELVDLPEPEAPKADEVLAAVEFAPINNSEILKITKRYALLPDSFPAGLGNEGVARILSVGRAVTALKPGDRVIIPPTLSSWRERLIIPAAGLFALPSADPQQLSMLSINPPTAALLLSEYVDLKPGEWVLQNAGNSGVGRSVIAIAKSRGLRTISIVRRSELIPELRALGGDVVVLDQPNLAATIAKETANAPIRLALDGVGGDSTATLSACVAHGGTVVLYARTSTPTVTGLDLIFRNVALRGFWMFYPQFASKLLEPMKLAAHLVAEQKLHVPVAATYPLSAFVPALVHAQSGGKVLFKI